MKNVTKGLTLMIALLMAFVTVAGNGANLKVQKEGNKSFSVSITDARQDMTLKVLNARGKILFSDEVAQNESLDRTFDFTLLPEGNYTLKVEDAFELESMPIVVSKDHLELKSDEISRRFRPVVIKDDQFIKVGVLPQGKENWRIVIKDPEGLVSYRTTLRGDQYMGKIFDVSKVSGTFEIELSTKDFQTTRSITMQ